MNRTAMTKLLRPIAALLLLAATACHSGQQASEDEAPPLAGAAIGGEFTLLDSQGRTVRWSDFDGKYRIVYFGYTFCPDACPTDVAVMMRGYAAFARTNAKLADQVQPIFISIDPARDTPAAVGQFAAAFSPKLLGLTGSPAAVAKAAKAFRVYYAKGRATTGGYLMDHSRIAYLMGRKGEPLAMLPVDKGPPQVAAELVRWVK